MEKHFEIENCDEKLNGMPHVYSCHINKKTGINSINLAWTGQLESIKRQSICNPKILGLKIKK